MAAEEKDSGNLELAAGGGLAAMAVAGAAAGAVCPLCVVGAPVLLGFGAYKKLKKK
jgi:hypothetical protein